MSLVVTLLKSSTAFRRFIKSEFCFISLIIGGIAATESWFKLANRTAVGSRFTTVAICSMMYSIKATPSVLPTSVK